MEDRRFIASTGNEDLSVLEELARAGRLRDVGDHELKVYLVVDGQQRLTTLLLLAHIYYARATPGLRPELCVTLRDGSIPRLIQHPAEDHDFLKKLVNFLHTQAQRPSPRRKSQQRMLDNAILMQKWQKETLAFFRSPNFKTSAIILDAGYGLTSFLTLNDRGKSLTVLEKLKSLLLQFAFDAQCDRLIGEVHVAFRKLYEVLDSCLHVKLFSEQHCDDEMMRLLSCYLWMDKDSKVIWQIGGSTL